eukprot:scaffold3759_cov425-Prasinococcus_capsulatus_cf.AAC.11
MVEHNVRPSARAGQAWLLTWQAGWGQRYAIQRCSISGTFWPDERRPEAEKGWKGGVDTSALPPSDHGHIAQRACATAAVAPRTRVAGPASPLPTAILSVAAAAASASSPHRASWLVSTPASTAVANTHLVDEDGRKAC